MSPSLEEATVNGRVGVVSFAVFVLALAPGCSVGDGHDHTHEADAAGCVEHGGEPMFTAFSVSPTTVAAGGAVEASIDGEHLGELAETESGAAEEHGHGGDCPGGHLHVYLDDLMTNPLAMVGAKSFQLTIPEETAAGEHILIVRLHNKDHTILTPEVTAQTAITVE